MNELRELTELLANEYGSGNKWEIVKAENTGASGKAATPAYQPVAGTWTISVRKMEVEPEPEPEPEPTQEPEQTEQTGADNENN